MIAMTKETLRYVVDALHHKLTENGNERLDSKAMDEIANKVRLDIVSTIATPNDILKGIESQVESLVERKRITLDQILTDQFKSDFVKEVLEQVPDAPQGARGFDGVKGEKGDPYILLEQDKMDIAKYVMDQTMSRDEIIHSLASLVSELKSGKIRIPQHRG